MAGKSKVQEAKRLDLLGALLQAGAEDLASIDAQIAEKEQALAAATREIETELAMLRQLRRVVDVRINGKPARKIRQPKAAAAAAKAANAKYGKQSADDDRRGQAEGFEAAAEDDDRIAPMHAALASQIVGLITRDGPMTAEAIARKLDRTPQGVRMAITKAGSLFKRMTSDRIGLPGSRDADDD